MATSNNAKYITVTQSSWTRGMQSKVLSARNDTDILSKGAALIDNMVIMQQGGLRKRPCTVVTHAIADNTNGFIFIGVVSLGGTLWAISFKNTTQEVKFSNIDLNIAPVVVSIAWTTAFKNVTYIQDGNTLLFAPSFKTVTYVDNTTFNVADFIFNSYPTAPEPNNALHFSNYLPVQIVHIIYYGDGGNDSRTQAQTANSYIAVGQTVLIYTEKSSSCQFIGLPYYIYVGGLIIKCLSNSFVGSDTFIYGLIVYGSTPALALIKDAVAPHNPTWTNVWSVTSTAGDLLFQNRSFDSTSHPVYMTNFQNRLITAGKTDSPSTTLWCSATGNKFSFVQTTSDDSSPFSVTINGDVSPIINNIVAYDYLYVMTNEGIYGFINNTNSTFTPTNINLKKIGIHRTSSTKPIQHDGQLFYIQENGRAVRSLTQSQGDIIDIERTILCPSFIKNARHLCATHYIQNVNESGFSDSSSYLLVVGDEINQDTGSATGFNCIYSYQYVGNQGIDGWTRWTFNNNNISALFTYQDRIFISFSGNSYIYEFKFGVYKDEYNGNQAPLIKIRTNPFSLRDPVQGDLLFRRKKYNKIELYYLNTMTVAINGIIYNVASTFDGEDNPTPKNGILRAIQTDNYEIINYVEITHQHDSDFQMIALSTTLEVE